MPYRTRIAAAVIALLSAGVATAAPPKVVSAPNSDPQCFAPWATNTKMFQYPAKKGPVPDLCAPPTAPHRQLPGASR